MHLDDFQKERQHIFPSEHSLRWFIRRHKSELLRSGALLRLTNRLFVHAEAFDAAIMRVGKLTAVASYRGGQCSQE